MLSWLLPFLLIRCPLVSWIIKLLFICCLPFIRSLISLPWIIRCFDVSIMFIFTRSTPTNWILRLSSVFSWATLLPKRVTSVFILPRANTVSMDVEFQEHTSYFSQDVPNSPLHGEHLVHLESSDYLIELLVYEILGLNQSEADL